LLSRWSTSVAGTVKPSAVQCLQHGSPAKTYLRSLAHAAVLRPSVLPLDSCLSLSVRGLDRWLNIVNAINHRQVL
jgi:hypothetical protein